MLFGDIVFIRGRSGQGMNMPGTGVYSDVRLHAVIPLVPLLRLVHFRIPLTGPVLGGRGGLNDRGVHDGAAVHHESRFLKTGFDVFEQAFAEIVLLKKMAEFQQRRRVGNLLRHEVQA